MGDLASAQSYLRVLQAQKQALQNSLAEMQSSSENQCSQGESRPKTIVDRWRFLEDENDKLDADIQAAQRLSHDLSHQKGRNSGRLSQLNQALRLAQSKVESEDSLFKIYDSSVRLTQSKVSEKQTKQQQIASDVAAIQSDLQNLTSEIQEDTRRNYSLLQSRIEELEGELDAVKAEEEDLAYRLEELRHRKRNEAQARQAAVAKAKRVREFQSEKFRLARELRSLDKLIGRERSQLADTEDRELAVARNASFA